MSQPVKKEKSQGWTAFRAAFPEKMKALPRKIGAGLKHYFQISKEEGAELSEDGFARHQPLLGLLFLLCAVLPVTENLRTAVFFALTAGAVLLLAALVTPLVLAHVPSEAAMPCGVLIVGALALAGGQVLLLFLPQEGAAAGLLMLLAAGPFVLGDKGEKAPKNGGYALVEALITWMGFALTVAGFAVVRELLGAGTLWSVHILPFQIQLLSMPAGGFLLAGGTVALLRLPVFHSGKGGGKA
ncbi:MAG: Rnf-Nqr domain containing protein [Oscillospiraceae bacterium]